MFSLFLGYSSEIGQLIKNRVHRSILIIKGLEKNISYFFVSLAHRLEVLKKVLDFMCYIERKAINLVRDHLYIKS